MTKECRKVTTIKENQQERKKKLMKGEVGGSIKNKKNSYSSYLYSKTIIMV